MSYFDKKPLTHITLLPSEVHLHSAVLVRATLNKLFGFVGPKVAGIQPLAPRYRAHITNQRLLMEIYPYSGTEKTVTKWGLKGVSMLMGSFVDTPQLHAQIAVQKMMYNAAMDENLAAADDPNAQYIAIPYDTLTVTTYGSAPSYLKLEIPGVEEEIVFIAQLDTEGRLLPKGNIIDNAKAGWGLSREFAKLCQEAIASYRSRA
ncbi:MAG: hypothetical protein WGN25_12315 [Candidatus Electrothrix sp. GW3-4]|uniref:hypothetical protein n=1 Tax=Candidatus Electrothrix sp. GW3-4 TaxID=3126740 RepID=UPI0030D5E34E